MCVQYSLKSMNWWKIDYTKYLSHPYSHCYRYRGVSWDSSSKCTNVNVRHTYWGPLNPVTEALHAVELTLFLWHMPEGVAEHSFLGCNNQSTCMPSYSLYVQLLWYPMYYSEGMKARVSPVQWSKPHSILAPTQDSNPGGRIQNHKRWPLHYHCTLVRMNTHIKKS